MLGFNWCPPHLSAWQRRLLIGVLTALTSQLYLSVWAEGFRVSAAAILYPALLVTVMRDSHRPSTGAVTGLCVAVLRMAVDLYCGTSFLESLVLECPGGIFYFCYDALLCLLVRDRRAATPIHLWLSCWLCDFLSNVVNLALSSRLSALENGSVLLSLAGLALARSFTACAILWATRGYRQLLLREEHEQRYRRLFLMTADLKMELYFLKKDAEDIESVMSHAYELYEALNREQNSPELSALALSIARDVHEVKKDNLRIIRGLEGEVEQAYDHETMALSDLLSILALSTRQFLGVNRADIRLECQYQNDLPIREHYRVLSILKNLVTNAVEAIQSDKGHGTVRVVSAVREGRLCFTVSDSGPGISQRGMKMLFQVGYSTKFDPDTGNINRGVGLSAVQYIVEELDGTIQVQSEPGQGAVFQVSLPLEQVAGGNDEALHH